MKVLVTGANGFLAGHVIKQLIENNYKVRAMLRSSSLAPALKGMPIEFYRGNITNRNDVSNAIKGCDVIIHAAADTNQAYKKFSDYFLVNVDATQIILDEMKKSDCKKIIFVSSANTIGFGSFTNPGIESNPISKLFSKSGYAYSKWKAQKLVLNSSKLGIFDAITVNPTFIIGPEDHNPHSGRIFKMIMNKKLVFYPPGGKNFVDVRDVAKGIVNSINLGINGECYLLAGENISYKQFFNLVLEKTKNKTILIGLPSFLIMLIGVLGSIFRFLNLKFELNLVNAKILCINNYYSNLKARKYLNFESRKINQTIEDSIDWIEESKKN